MRFIAVFVVVCTLLFAGCSDLSDNTETSNSEASAAGNISSSKSDSGDDNASSTDASGNEPTEVNEMKIIINGAEFTAKFSDTKAAEEFKEMLPLTLEMTELNGNEKYFYLDKNLSAKSENVGHINCGDIMLYGSSCVVLFYDSFNTSYSYTRIGYIENPDGLKKAVGGGSVTVEFK